LVYTINEVDCFFDHVEIIKGFMKKVLHVKECLINYVVHQRTIKQFRLPPERALAMELGYSRATIGKALGILEGEGVIVRKRGSGNFIVDQEKTVKKSIALAMRKTYDCTSDHFRMIVEETSKYAEKNNIGVRIFDNLTEIFEQDPNNNPLLKAIRSGKIDGVLITSRMPLSIISGISSECPMVSINNIFGDGVKIPSISCDYFRLGFIAGKHLLDCGHRKVAYVTRNLAHPESTFALSGFRSAFEMAGIDLAESDILDTKLNLNIFRKRIIKFFKNSNYTACFVRNTLSATRMISILRKNGMNIPEDLSIISGGNYTTNRQNKMRLTVIDNQLDEMCHIGLNMLQNMIKVNNTTEGGIKLLTPRLIENDSCLKIDYTPAYSKR
jgi:DNA-binding LacI/PurR family transcriptional regulator